MAPGKNVVFDVVGTLVGYEELDKAIDARLGDRLRGEGIKPVLFMYTWIEVAEREYTYLSMSGKYVSFAEVFEKIFWRILWWANSSIDSPRSSSSLTQAYRKAGIKDARGFANREDLKYIVEEGYKKQKLRPGAKECIEKLRGAGFTVRCFTVSGAYHPTSTLNADIH